LGGPAAGPLDWWAARVCSELAEELQHRDRARGRRSDATRRDEAPRLSHPFPLGEQRGQRVEVLEDRGVRASLRPFEVDEPRRAVFFDRGLHVALGELDGATERQFCTYLGFLK
jgi:hypothetical protein